MHVHVSLRPTGSVSATSDRALDYVSWERSPSIASDRGPVRRCEHSLARQVNADRLGTHMRMGNSLSP